MFEGDSADKCSSPHHMSENFPGHMSAESPLNISTKPSKVISEVSEPMDNFWK
jgi:hypothetical protein